MANSVYFVDSTTGSDVDNGTTMDLALATVEKAVELGGLGLGEGDVVFVRRVHSEIPASDILAYYDGEPDNPIKLMGWPRPAIPNTTITQADFTNGSKIIDNVVGITPSRTQHTGRYITAPDGEQYMITAVLWEAGVDGMAGGAEYTVGSYATNTTQTKKGKIWAFTDNADTTGTIQYARDSATAWVNNDNVTDADGGDAEIDASGETAVGFLIDREYAGSTVTGTSGKFAIDADEYWFDDMGTEYGFDDTAWTIKESAWDADAIDLPVIDFNDAAYQWRQYRSDFWIISGIEFKDSADTNGLVYAEQQQSHVTYLGCLFKQTTTNVKILCQSTAPILLRKCIIEGSGAGTSQIGVYGRSSLVDIRDSVIMNCGDNAVFMFDGHYIFDNVNMGIEIPNGGDDIKVYYNYCTGRNVSLGGTNGYIALVNQDTIPATSHHAAYMENYQKILGDHKTWTLLGTHEKAAVSGETPNKKLSDNVIKVVPDGAFGTPYADYAYNDWKIYVMEHEIQAVTGSQTFKYWIYNDALGTLNGTNADDNVHLEAEYVKSHDDTSEWTMAKALSTETSIASAADADDWDSLSVTINPAVASKVRLRIYVAKQHATGVLFIDPQVVIT